MKTVNGMNNNFYDSNSNKMGNFLFQKGDYPFKGRFYWFLVLHIENEADEKPILDFLREMLFDVVFIKINKDDIVAFYFNETDLDFRSMQASIGEDFSLLVQCFGSGPMSTAHPENFEIIFNAYQKYLSKKPLLYYGIVDLLLEIIKTDLRDLLSLKSAILNRVEDDSQLECLILNLLECDLNVTKTAHLTYMHRNTVINKLEFIKAQTGLNVQHFKDAACMYWLIKTK